MDVGVPKGLLPIVATWKSPKTKCTMDRRVTMCHMRGDVCYWDLREHPSNIFAVQDPFGNLPVLFLQAAFRSCFLKANLRKRQPKRVTADSTKRSFWGILKVP